MIRCTVLAAVLAAAAASETDATQNELRRASETRAREAAYQQQAYAPNLGSGGIDVQAAGQRLIEQIRAAEQADAAEQAASGARSRQAFAAIAARRAEEDRLHHLVASRNRLAVEGAWWRRVVGDFSALLATPAAARDALAWRRLCASRVGLWELAASLGDRHAPTGEPVAWHAEQTMALLRQAAAGGLDEAVAACAVLDLQRRVAAAQVAADLDRHLGGSPEKAPVSAVLAACLLTGIRIPEERQPIALIGDLFRSESYLGSRLAGGLAARVLDGPPLPDARRGRLVGLLQGIERGGSPGLAMCARTALVRLEPAAPRRSLHTIWQVPDGHTGEAFREWAFLDQFLSGLAAAGRGDSGPLDRLTVELSAHPRFLSGQPLARLAWMQLQREAAGWRVEAGALAGLLQPLPRPGDPWSHPWATKAMAPLPWLPARGIVDLAKARAQVVEDPSSVPRLDFGDLRPEDRMAKATATMPAEIPWLPGDQAGTGLSPLTWSWIQERLAIQALATARMPDLPAPHARIAAALAGRILLSSAGSLGALAGYDAMPTVEPGFGNVDKPEALRCRARASMLLGTAIEIGTFSDLPGLPWTLAAETAVWHHVDAAMMSLLWLEYARNRQLPGPVTEDWPARLALRLARRDMDAGTVPPGRWWPTAQRFVETLRIFDYQHLGPRLAEACLSAGLPMDAQVREVLERQAAWWRDRDR